MPEGRLIAISDVHLDTWREADPDSFAAKTQAFVDFFAWVRDASGAEHLAIVGDLLDVPQLNHAPLLPLCGGLLPHLWSLRQSGIHVHYIVGNHDAGLMGLDVALAEPALEVSFPGLTVDCAGLPVRLEHGHLLDAWLWGHLQYKLTRIAAVPPAEAMAPFLTDPSAQATAAPAMAFLQDGVYEALQWRALEAGFTREEKVLGLQIMSQHLEDTFADVADPGELPRKQDEIMGQLAAAGITVEQLQAGRDLPDDVVELFWPVGERFYSALPWRRAAQCRLRTLRRERPACRTLVMGHIHHADVCTWDEDGTVCTYANCGTWTGSHGDFVCLDPGEARAFPRKWSDPLPEL